MTNPISPTAEPDRTPATRRPEPDARWERQGRAWLVGAFVFCPCHLPLTLAALSWVLGGTALGVAVRESPWLAAAVTTTAWIVGTAYGFVLLRRARQGTCPLPPTPERPARR